MKTRCQSDLWQVQISDTHGKELGLKSDGALYDFHAPRADASREAGRWNFMEVMVIGRKITVVQNSVMIHQNATCSGSYYDNKEGQGPRDLDADGPIALQGDHGGISYANVWIMECKPH